MAAERIHRKIDDMYAAQFPDDARRCSRCGKLGAPVMWERDYLLCSECSADADAKSEARRLRWRRRKREAR